MPILGAENSTNQIYRKQIREVLDEDLNIYRQVFDREKRQVKDFNEIATPQNLILNDDKINVMRKYIDEFKKIINQHIIEINKVLNGGLTSPLSNPNTYELVSLYNSMITLISTPANNKVTSDNLKNMIVQVIPDLTNLINISYLNIRRSLDDAVNAILNPTVRAPSSYNIGLNYEIMAYSTNKLMLELLENGRYRVITTNDIYDYYNKIVESEFSDRIYRRIIATADKVDLKRFFDKRESLETDAETRDALQDKNGLFNPLEDNTRLTKKDINALKPPPPVAVPAIPPPPKKAPAKKAPAKVPAVPPPAIPVVENLVGDLFKEDAEPVAEGKGKRKKKNISAPLLFDHSRNDPYS